MPVDYCVYLLPVLCLISALVTIVVRRSRKVSSWITLAIAALFLAIYFLPGWLAWPLAQLGNRDAQYALGEYYWTRLSYNWSDIEARDKWWVRAAKRGHSKAMYQVGYFSMFGTSSYIPRDLDAAEYWLKAAKDAGDLDAADALETLDNERRREQAKDGGE